MTPVAVPAPGGVALIREGVRGNERRANAVPGDPHGTRVVRERRLRAMAGR